MTARYVVLEDDPTGTQLLSGVELVTATDEATIRSAGEASHAVHVLTNSRALTAEESYRTVRRAAQAARRAQPGAEILLRGDSTLRAHLLPEFRAVAESAFPGAQPLLVLCPAMPSGGRVTRDGVHGLLGAGQLTALHHTEFARDGEFSYSCSHLLRWAEERSGGYFPVADGATMSRRELHAEGADGVLRRIRTLAAAGRPAVFAPDSEDLADQCLVAEGVRRARAADVPLVVRASPSFAGAICGTLAVTSPTPPLGRVLVVCGSYVGGATRQLRALVQAVPDVLVELDLDGPGAAARAAGRVTELLDDRGLAVLATPRERPEHLRTLAGGARVMEALVDAAARAHPAADVVVAKGGITSAEVLRVALGARRATVLGPIVPGVALLEAHGADGDKPFVIVPGNVGADDILDRVVRLTWRSPIVRDTV